MAPGRTAIFLLLLTAALAPARAAAQENAQLSGTWIIDRGQSDDIEAKINLAIGRMNLLVRQIARPRLRATNVPYPQLVFANADVIHADMPGYPSIASPANGDPVLWHRKTGSTCPRVHTNCVEVTTTWADGSLVQNFRSEDGQRQNVFTVSPDGATMTLAVRMTSPRLPAPLLYRLIYNRAP
jgi:hypothetical protein